MREKILPHKKFGRENEKVKERDAVVPRTWHALLVRNDPLAAPLGTHHIPLRKIDFARKRQAFLWENHSWEKKIKDGWSELGAIFPTSANHSC